MLTTTYLVKSPRAHTFDPDIDPAGVSAAMEVTVVDTVVVT